MMPASRHRPLRSHIRLKLTFFLVAFCISCPACMHGGLSHPWSIYIYIYIYIYACVCVCLYILYIVLGVLLNLFPILLDEGCWYNTVVPSTVTARTCSLWPFVWCSLVWPFTDWQYVFCVATHECALAHRCRVLHWRYKASSTAWTHLNRSLPACAWLLTCADPDIPYQSAFLCRVKDQRG